MGILFNYFKVCGPILLNRVFLAIVSSILYILTLGGNEAYCQIQKKDSLVKALQTANSPNDSIELLIALSDWYIRVDFRRAVEYANQAVEIGSSVGGKSKDADARSHRALVHWYNGEYSNSIKLNDESISLRKQTGDSLGIANNYQKIALCYYYQADYLDAIKFHQLSYEIFKRSGTERQIASSLNQIALVYNKMGDYGKAATYLYDFAKIRQSFEGYQGRTYNLLQSTPFFRSKEYFQVELELQLKAVEKLLINGKEIDILFTYLNIADSYRELGDYEKVLLFLKKANAYYERFEWMPNFYGLGNAYLKLNMVDSAIYQFEQGIRVAEEKGTQITLLALHTGLGESLEKKGDYENALRELKIGLKMTSDMGNKLDVVLTQLKMVEVYMKTRNWNKALDYCEASLRLAYQINSRKQIKDALNLKSEIMRSLGNYSEALGLFEKAKRISDSLTAGEADFQFAKMQVQFELDKKTKNIEILEQEKEFHEASIKNKDQLIIGFIVVLFLLILLAISAYLRYRQKIRANKILVEQKHKIEMLLSEVHHRVKNNLQIISSLLSIQSDQLKDVNARMAVLEGQSRVQAMGLIHENIYRSDNFAFIQMDEYIRMMSDKLVESFGFTVNELKVNISAKEISVDVDTAIHIGLIINELVTNSLKHAFKNISDPVIWISLYVEEGNLLALDVRDNGGGFLTTSNQGSFGLKLVRELAQQMGGTIEFIQNNGLVVSVRLTKFKIAA